MKKTPRRDRERVSTAAPMPARRATSWWPVAVAIALVAAGGTFYLARAWQSRTAAARLLPTPPDLTGRPAAMAAHIAGADAVARRSPAGADVVGALGMAYHADLFYEQATAAYERAASLDAGNWEWPYYRSLVHLERGEAEQAAAALTAVVNARPDLGIAWWRLGEARFKQGNDDAADAAYAQAESHPSDRAAGSGAPGIEAYSRVGRARLALNRGDAPAAVDILTKLIAAEPRFGPAHRILAEVFRVEGRLADAERHGALGARLRAYAGPGDALVDRLADVSRSSVFLLRQAASLDLVRERARREQLVRRALESDPANPDVVYEMGALLQQFRQPADALPYFTRHLDMVDDDQQTLVQIGKCQSDLGRLDEAESSLRKALALGNDAVGFYNLGVVLEQRQRLNEAEAAYRRAIANGPGLASARNNLGGLLAASGRLDEAERQLLESIRLDPSTPDAYTNLSAARLQQRAFADAARYAGLAIDLDPRLADAHANLGVALASLGQLDAARQALGAALRIDPRHANARQNLEALTRVAR